MKKLNSRLCIFLFTLTLALVCGVRSSAAERIIDDDDVFDDVEVFEEIDYVAASETDLDTAGFSRQWRPEDQLPSIYSLPASWTLSVPHWHRMWVNTGVLCGAFLSTLFVLEMLPEDATAWNRAEFQNVPFYQRWYEKVIVNGPEADGDLAIFNYVLHPYAGAAYFMSARSCGFNFYQSLLYCTLISNVGWEFGVEGCMEPPSIQDLLVTPLVGSALGEGFYRLKRVIVNNDYRIAGSRVLGNTVAFIIDPVNEVVNLFRGSDTRGMMRKSDNGAQVSSGWMVTPKNISLTVNLTF